MYLCLNRVDQREEILLPYLGVLSSFRDGIRQSAISKADSALKEILKLCDRLRDEDLVPLGVALDDQEGSCFFCFTFVIDIEDSPQMVKPS